jgi:signal transduction histidine kinase
VSVAPRVSNSAALQAENATTAMRVLVVEDDGRVASFIQRGLEEEGFAGSLGLPGAARHPRPEGRSAGRDPQRACSADDLRHTMVSQMDEFDRLTRLINQLLTLARAESGDRADPARTRQSSGAGLGLALAKWIADRHNATIGVQSRPGAGNTFTVSLPGL